MKTGTKRMKCADEPGFPVRDFHMDNGDGTCSHCGWMQTSFEAGVRELANLATWHDPQARAEYERIAEQEGDKP